MNNKLNESSNDSKLHHTQNISFRESCIKKHKKKLHKIYKNNHFPIYTKHGTITHLVNMTLYTYKYKVNRVTMCTSPRVSPRCYGRRWWACRRDARRGGLTSETVDSERWATRLLLITADSQRRIKKKGRFVWNYEGVTMTYSNN